MAKVFRPFAMKQRFWIKHFMEMSDEIFAYRYNNITFELIKLGAELFIK